ncbi:MAG: methyltransferase domain-containing protein [Candidatus Diapherotrites archaeon]|nr:methyltransferase domain-containing protein [Candidatus Diapherotrites archaeon]MDZ4256772.1 methyltransferase domain-containing protein [archaeon]
MRNRIDTLLASLSGKVLDIGGSAGTLHDELKKRFPDSQIVSLDIELIHVRTNQVLGDGQRMPFEDRSFNSILAGEVIEHVANPKAFIDECWRVLEHNGVLALSTPNQKSWLNRITHSYEMPLHLSLFDPVSIRGLLEQGGFTIQKMVFFPYTEESSDGATHKWFFPIRKTIHHIFPDSLREQMVVIARKIARNRMMTKG